MFRIHSAGEFNGWDGGGMPSTTFLDVDGGNGGGLLATDSTFDERLMLGMGSRDDSWAALDALEVANKQEEPGAPQEADEPPQLPTLSSGMLRCIDDTHPADCTRCTPAPLDPTGVELVGEHGKKNGEKILRSLVTRIPEWNLLSERRKLVPLARVAGLAPLAVALEEKKTSALRKAHLIFMARSWGYKCDLWTPKHDRAADRALEQLQRRAAADAEAKHAPALPLPRFGATAVAAWNGVWDESLLVPDAVWLFAQKALRPLSLRVAAGFAGDDARAAALTHGDAHVTLTLATEVSRVAAMMPFMAQNLGGVHSTIISGARSLSAEMASQPAWRCLASPPFNVTDSLLRGVMDSANGLISAVARASSLRIRKGGLNPAERVWLQEMYTSLNCTLELLGQVSRVLTAFRAASLESFLTVAGTMLELMIVLVTSLGSASTQREHWMTSMIAARGSEGADSTRASLLVCYPIRPGELSEDGDDAAQAQQQPQQPQHSPQQAPPSRSASEGRQAPSVSAGTGVESMHTGS